MARVVLPRGLASLTGGELEIEVAASNVRQLIRALETRYPGIAERLEGEVSIAIDGEVCGDATFEPLTAASEVHFIPRIGGGRGR